MNALTYSNKLLMANFFGISGGYVFAFLKDRKIEYNKNNTRDIILESCAIDIYNDPEFDISQEKCIRKIWSQKDDFINGKLLEAMLDYYVEVANWSWSYKEQSDYDRLRVLQNKLLSQKSIQLPEQEGYSLNLLKQDIQDNFSTNKPELVLDRLHTFATQFFRNICAAHQLSICSDKGENYSLDTVVANLKKYYKESNYFESEFCVIALQNTINIFAKFNAIRNERSFSHPNPILEKTEAEYVVRIIADTIIFIDKIEKQMHLQEKHKDAEIFDDELPF